MLVACRSFADDDYGAVTRAVTIVAAGHELVRRFPERFELATPCAGEERSGAGGETIRATNMTLGMVEHGEGATIVGLGVPYGFVADIEEFGTRFREKFAPFAFRRSLAEDRWPLLLDHGRDPRLGRRPVGKPTRTWEDPAALRFEADLLTDDPDVANHVVPGIRASLYGASVRFKPLVTDVQPPRRGERLELRTVREARLRELSVTSMPAYGGTSVALAQ
jgi:uncharacterized protein